MTESLKYLRNYVQISLFKTLKVVVFFLQTQSTVRIQTLKFKIKLNIRYPIERETALSINTLLNVEVLRMS